MNFWLHLEKGAKASAIFSRGNTFPFPKIRSPPPYRFQSENIALG
jgi:hypothetical protein